MSTHCIARLCRAAKRESRALDESIFIVFQGRPQANAALRSVSRTDG
jgi:hypothetical protein